jgi:hypothetical protein
LEVGRRYSEVFSSLGTVWWYRTVRDTRTVVARMPGKRGEQDLDRVSRVSVLHSAKVASRSGRSQSALVCETYTDYFRLGGDAVGLIIRVRPGFVVVVALDDPHEKDPTMASSAITWGVGVDCRICWYIAGRSFGDRFLAFLVFGLAVWRMRLVVSTTPAVSGLPDGGLC